MASIKKNKQVLIFSELELNVQGLQLGGRLSLAVGPMLCNQVISAEL